MKQLRRSPDFLALVLPLCSLLVGCGGSQFEAGTDPAGNAGASGAGGAGQMGGASGSGGATPGQGGSSGKGGPGGSGGAGGQGGSAGSTGKGGSGGAPGGSGGSTGGQGASAGSAGKSGSAGAAGGAAGVAGASGSGGSASGAAGNAGSGGSSPNSCDPSSTKDKFKCVASLLLACNPATLMYEQQQTCASKALCDAAHGVCDVCLAGETSPTGACADPTHRTVCNDSGSGYDKAEKCPDGSSHCVSNKCQGCLKDGDCPAGGGVCSVPSCESGVCSTKPALAGTPVPSMTNACQVVTCDGQGNASPVYAAQGTVVQGALSGLCFATECDGMGGQSVVNKPVGTVVDSTNECAPTTCDGSGNPVVIPEPLGTACGDAAQHDHICDGQKACQPCYPAPDGSGCKDKLLCDPNETPADMAFFVAPNGSDAADGSRFTPLATLAEALARMYVLGEKRRNIHLAPGAYVGGVNPPLEFQGQIQIDGGWTVDAQNFWSRDCFPQAYFNASITGGARAVVDASVAGQSIFLKSVVIKAGYDPAFSGADYNAPGASSIGIFVANGAAVSLVASDIEIGDGQAGGYGSLGMPGSSGACGATPTCSDGANGAQGAAGPPGAGTPQFADSGFQGVVGQSGQPGTPGDNGTAAVSMTYECSYGTCAFLSGNKPPCFNPSLGLTYSKTGMCGCGGQPGKGGLPGQPGGASVAAYMAGANAQLTTLASKLVSGNGGAGGKGGNGGMGGMGSKGTTGAPLSCQLTPPTCNAQCQNVGGSQPVMEPGSTAGRGGDGGLGGAGSDGSNGLAASVVMNKAATFTPSPGTSLVANGSNPTIVTY